MRMIDADALLDAICGAYNILENAGVDLTVARSISVKIIKNAPTVKPCTCGSCMHGYGIGHGLIACNKPGAGYNNTHEPDWYCAEWLQRGDNDDETD